MARGMSGPHDLSLGFCYANSLLGGNAPINRRYRIEQGSDAAGLSDVERGSEPKRTSIFITRLCDGQLCRQFLTVSGFQATRPPPLDGRATPHDQSFF